MAVYTEVQDEEIVSLLKDYGVGDFVEKIPILAGVENTNYRIETTTGPYILTLFERRVCATDLPFFMALMSHLAEKGMPAAAPVIDKAGASIRKLANKPAALIRFVPGKAAMAPNENQCGALGAALADWHQHVADFKERRTNPLSLAGWRELALSCGRRANECAPGLAVEIAEELEALSAVWPDDLPAGVVHTDLFPDNVHFEGDRIVGLIDFYFSAEDFFAYDIATCVNSWCFNEERKISTAKAAAMLGAYEAKRPLSEKEKAAFPIFLRGAALRFLLTRLYDWLHQVEGAMVKVKDPLEFRDILIFHRAQYAPSDYGF